MVEVNNGYASFGGLVAGYRNPITRTYASLIGGIDKRAGGDCSSFSGGDTRSVSGDYDRRAGSLFEDNSP